MARYARRRKTVRPFRAMRKARMYRSKGLYAFGRSMYRGARNLANAVHTFRKSVMLSNITDTGSIQHLGYQFNLDQLAEEADFQSLYDSYKIKKIILSLEPQFSGTNASAAPYQNWLRVVHDYDDITPLTTQNQYLEYAGCKSHLVTQPRIIRIPLYPKIQTINQTSGGTGLITRPVKSTWLPTASDLVDHLGLKIMVPSCGLSVGSVLFLVRATFVIQMKNSK